MGNVAGNSQSSGEAGGQKPTPSGRQIRPQHPDSENGSYDREPGCHREGCLQEGDSTRVDDPVVLIRQQSSVHDLQCIVLLARYDALAFPLTCLILVAADILTQQIIVKLGSQPDGFADEKAPEFQSDVRGGGPIFRFRREACQANGLEVFGHSSGDISREWRFGGRDRPQQVRQALGFKRRPASQHLEYHAAEGKDV